TCYQSSWRKRAALIYLVFGFFVCQLAMLGHVICSDKKTTLPTIAWVAICITIPLIGYAFWLLEKDQKN
ncbi:MAG: PLDc N-terminal domain-containing protein, partial [Usitatibacteraceae bacterium]